MSKKDAPKTQLVKCKKTKVKKLSAPNGEFIRKTIFENKQWKILQDSPLRGWLIPKMKNRWSQTWKLKKGKLLIQQSDELPKTILKRLSDIVLPETA